MSVPASPGYGARCKACNSPRRTEIDRRLLGGESTRTVSAWLAAQGEEVAHVSLGRHLAEHLAVLDAAKARLVHAGVAAAAPVFEAAVAKVVADVGLLDEIASLAMHHARSFADRAPEGLPEVTLFTGALREARAAVKTKHELLHGKKLNVDATDLADFLALAFDGDPGAGEGGAGPLGE